MTFVLVVLFGAIVGLALGTLGGGGSILVVPAMVYGLGLPTAEATNLSQLVVGATSLVALLFRWRTGRVRWGTALLLAIAGALGAVLGREAVRMAPEWVVMICLGTVSVLIAVLMLRHSLATEGDASAAADQPNSGGPQRPSWAQGSRAMFCMILAAGAAVGFLTGFLGIGGGFLTVPVLVLALGFSMQSAIGTALMVMALNCSSSVLYDGVESVDWNLAIPFMAVAMICAVGGHRASRHLSESTLQRWFGTIILLLGLALLIGNLVVAAGWLPTSGWQYAR